MAAEEGQSLIEFLLLLPAILALALVLVRINTSIQSGIVNQQYARAQLFFLAGNSSEYPRLELRNSVFEAPRFQTNQMVVGVSENSIPVDREERPQVSKLSISRNPSERITTGLTTVEIRSAITLCTQSNVLQGGSRLASDPSEMLKVKSSKEFDYCRPGLIPYSSNGGRS